MLLDFIAAMPVDEPQLACMTVARHHLSYIGLADEAGGHITSLLLDSRLRAC